MRKLLKTMGKAVLVAAIVMALLGCAIFAEFFFGIAPSSNSSRTAGISMPELTGSYPIGRRVLEWTDESRSDPFHKTTKRELVVFIWYPSQIISMKETSSYLPGERGLMPARFQSMMMRARVQSFWSSLVRNPLPKEAFTGIKTRAFDDGPVSFETRRFPLLLFMPGLGAMATEYTALLEDVASHGYIVVAINPTDFTPVTAFENGRTVYAPVWDVSLYDLEKDYWIWVRDLFFVLNEFFRESKDPRSPFFERLDMTKVGAFGHSFGGAAAAGACHSDSRIGAGLNLDGAPYGGRPTWKFPQPFMLVQSGGRAYRDSGDEEFVRELETGYRAVIEGSTHHAFTDEVMLPLPEGRRKALVGSIPGPKMVRMTSSLVCAFFDIHLQRKPSTLLQDIHSHFPEITIQAFSLGHSARRAQ